jgi:hypothetical protein
MKRKFSRKRSKRSFKRRKFSKKRTVFKRRRVSRRIRAPAKALTRYSLQQQIPIGYPRNRRAVLRWWDTFQTASATSTVLTQDFLANSIAQPSTASGKRPYLYDEWHSFYDAYYVVGSKISIWVRADPGAPDSASAGFNEIATTVTCNRNSMAGMSWQHLKETGLGNSWRIIYPAGSAVGAVGSNTFLGSSAYLKKKPDLVSYYSPKKYFDLAYPKDDPLLRSDFSASPATGATFTYCYVDCTGSAGTNVSHIIDVQIDYMNSHT